MRDNEIFGKGPFFISLMYNGIIHWLSFSYQPRLINNTIPMQTFLAQIFRCGLILLVSKTNIANSKFTKKLLLIAQQAKNLKLK